MAARPILVLLMLAWAHPGRAGGYPPLPATGCPARADFANQHHAVVRALPACSPESAAVDGRIIRGGAPTAAGLACLRSQGVTTIIDLRDDGEGPDERAWAESLGLRYQRFAMVLGPRGSRGCPVAGRPAAACNARALEAALAAVTTALAASPDAKLYVHCTRGEDRTGLLIAALRLRQGCAPAAARREMRAHFYSPYPALEGVWQRLVAAAP